jgi:hypothetical protein
MLDCSVFGLHPGGHHATSVLIHAAAAGLLLLGMTRMTGQPGRSAFVAGLFALHPLHVESVAWIAERKDVLSGLFFALTLLAWRAYARRPSPARYLLAAAAFAAGLMCKPMLVTLPCVLLLLDWWPLRRVKGMHQAGDANACPRAPWPRLLLEKVPLLALSAALSVVTFVAQRDVGAMVEIEALPLRERMGHAVISAVAYLGKAVWPAGLAVIYDRPELPGGGAIAAAAGLLGAITLVALVMARRRPGVIVGWLWFLGMLVPVLGLVQVGRQSMADRFMHLPLIGLSIAVAWAWPESLWSRPASRRAGAGIAVALLAACAAVSITQARHWRNTLTLFERALAVTTDNRVAMNNVAWIRATDPDPALRDPARAQALATRLCELTNETHPVYLDTLAAARAAGGDYTAAVFVAQRAMNVASLVGEHAMAREILGRIALYRQGTPYLSPVSAADPVPRSTIDVPHE